MESSDENFAWTDASSTSSKDTDMVVDMKRGSDRDEAHKNESHGEPETIQREQKHKEKKRKKHVIHEEIENNNSNDQINQSIKSEPNSDFDAPKNKKRHKRDKTSSSSHHDETLHEAEDYLNLRVKQEQATFVEPSPMKTKKKKKHKEKSDNSEEQELELSVPYKDEIDIDNYNFSCPVNGDHSEISELDISDRKKKKKKKKLSMEYDTSEILEDSEDSHKTNKKKHLYEAEDYLNLRVKQEHATFAEPTPMKTTKKKKHKEDLKQNEPELKLSAPSKDEINVHENNLDTSCLVNDDHSETSEIDISNRKTKKKKKEKLSMDYDTSEILEDSADSCQTKNKKNKELLQADDGDDELQHEEKSQISNSKILSSTLIQENGSIQENGRKQYNSDASTLESNPRTSAHKSSEVSLKKACRISDRIQFEEDSVDYEPKEDIPKLDIQLQQYISSNVNLRQLQDWAGEPCISDDDEVWIFKVPHDISVGDLENTNLTLDGKKKVKINGNTYDINIDTTVSATPILIFNKKKVFIKNIPSKGVINLRKRIPKIHIPYESLTMSNENSFIPLPDTKCRHPLFGAHYRSAARVPPAVAERLHRASLPPRAAAADADVKPNIEELHSHRKKRKLKEKLKKESDTDANPGTEALSSKKKKRKSKERLRFEADSETKPSMEVSHSKKKNKKNKRRLETESDMEMKLNTEALHSNKKKRKHSEERGARKKAKREKHDPSGADAWDSERAIEKNLFDF